MCSFDADDGRAPKVSPNRDRRAGAGATGPEGRIDDGVVAGYSPCGPRELSAAAGPRPHPVEAIAPGSHQPWPLVRVSSTMRIAEFCVRTGPEAPAAIRRAIDGVPGLPPEARADLRLLASELATSHALVGREPAAAVLVLGISRSGGVTRLDMDVRRRRPPPGPGDAEPLPGPSLLERVCARWGMIAGTAGAALWLEMDDAPVGAPSICFRPAAAVPA
jgi:hypothetical protein